ncbi:hypothetical protein ScPMuIL_007032 [Solemya velum]
MSGSIKQKATINCETGLPKSEKVLPGAQKDMRLEIKQIRLSKDKSVVVRANQSELELDINTKAPPSIIRLPYFTELFSGLGEEQINMEIVVVHARSGKELTTLKLLPSSTILDVKIQYEKENPKYYVDRQSYRIDPKAKSLKDSETLASLGFTKKSKLYFKDLGPQVGWTTVFLTEYAGPLVIYLLFYIRPSIIYGAVSAPKADVVKIAAACWTFHYAKRLLETVFVHRFSHATMPILNIFKNSGYYWGFTAFVAYYINHPLYTPPAFGDIQLYGGLAMFLFSELGNLSIHVALRNLRPPGSKERRIPYPGGNPFTWLFGAVSCPNYSYEVMAWVGFTIMTQCLPAGLFTSAGFFQMTIWALGKHKNYRHEFKDYPRGRKSIIPFII